MIPPIYILVVMAIPLLLAGAIFIDGLSRCPQPPEERRLSLWSRARNWWSNLELPSLPFGGPCRHLHYREMRSFTFDGTPWRVFQCRDCDYFDRGHVYGPSRGQPGSEDWEGTTET